MSGKVCNMIVVRGGGDIATGVVQKLHRAGYSVIILETAAPTAIRRSVALCEAVYDGAKKVEEISCKRISTLDEVEDCLQDNIVPMIIDPNAELIATIKPTVVVDAILAKRNLGTYRSMASITIALGPGFCAGDDVDIVIETMRGHDLGRLIFNGCAASDTGVPGDINGKSAERVLRSPKSGIAAHNKQIGDIAEQGDAVLTVDGICIRTQFTGLVRGLIREGISVKAGMKVADIDPRTDINVHTISDKARCLGGAVLEGVLMGGK